MSFKEKDKRKDVAIVRMEQLYPFPARQIDAILKKYDKAELFWVQEEPENMGAWTFILNRMRNTNIKLISRRESPSPATGSSKLHARQQQEIIDKTFE